MSEDGNSAMDVALESRLYSRLEKMGFVRDSRQGPRIICFRREIATVVQLFSVLKNVNRRPNFRILYTEAPRAGIEYGGKHLDAGDIFPGNFALPQGWLKPQHGGTSFRLRQALWRRLLTSNSATWSSVVEEVLQSLPEVFDWWENKRKGAHLLLLPSRPAPATPSHAPVFGHPVKTSLLQKFFAPDAAWTVGFFSTAVAVTLALAIQAYPDWVQMLTLTLAGAILGVMVAAVCTKILWHVRVRINGGPFRRGDLVQIIGGVHAGRIAAVYEEWPSRNQVRVDLDDAAWKDVRDVFSYVQLCRVKNLESVQAESNRTT